MTEKQSARKKKKSSSNNGISLSDEKLSCADIKEMLKELSDIVQSDTKKLGVRFKAYWRRGELGIFLFLGHLI